MRVIEPLALLLLAVSTLALASWSWATAPTPGAPTLSLVLPGDALRLEALRAAEPSTCPPGGDVLRATSGDRTLWTTAVPGAALEGLDLVDLDGDQSFEVVATWRLGGAAARLQVQLLRPCERGPGIVFQLDEPAVEGEAELAGDPTSGQTALHVHEGLPGAGWRRPYLRRHRTFFLRGERVSLLSESLDEPTTPEQFLVAAERYEGQGDRRRARACAERLLGLVPPGSRAATAARSLLGRLEPPTPGPEDVTGPAGGARPGAWCSAGRGCRAVAGP